MQRPARLREAAFTGQDGEGAELAGVEEGIHV
jgi:hypothetical protein